MTAEQKQVGGLSTSASCPAQHLLVHVGRPYKQLGSAKPVIGGWVNAAQVSTAWPSVAVSTPVGVCGHADASAQQGPLQVAAGDGQVSFHMHSARICPSLCGAALLPQ